MSGGPRRVHCRTCSKGLSYLAELLADPGGELYALALAADRGELLDRQTKGRTA
jgi:hypothetical protein